MTPAKQQAIKAIKELPEKASMNDIIERLHFIAQVSAGIKDADEGRTITHEEMKKRARKWLARPGKIVGGPRERVRRGASL